MSDLGRIAIVRLDKEAGITSHDAVDRLRRIVGTRRVGHAGTLDPFATGLLLLAWGRATRLLAFLAGVRKTYRATLELGRTTDTGDVAGRTLAQRPVPADALAAARLAETARALTGTILQRVPVYSAVKVGGEPLHRKARRGELVEPPTRTVTVHALSVRGVDAPRARIEFDVTCSSGTYVRSLAQDWAEALGPGGTLVALRRLAIGRHSVEGAIPTAELLDRPEGSIPAWNDRLRAAGLTPEEALADLPRLDLTAEEAARLAHGVAPSRTRARAALEGRADGADAEVVALFGPDGLLAGVAALDGAEAAGRPGAASRADAAGGTRPADAPLALRYVAAETGARHARARAQADEVGA